MDHSKHMHIVDAADRLVYPDEVRTAPDALRPDQTRTAAMCVRLKIRELG